MNSGWPKLFILGAAAAVFVPAFGGRVSTDEDVFWKTALGAARWLDASAVQTPAGLAWPADPRDPKTANATLYSGTPGVVLFYLEARAAAEARGLKDEAEAFLGKAKAGADELLGGFSAEGEIGLYTGLAGAGFALEEAYKASRETRFRDGLVRIVGEVRARARKVGAGIEWGSVTDIIGGTAGAGLFLLYAAAELADPSCLDLAAQAGDRLLELGTPKNGGLDWAMDPGYPRRMPNFAHGTAGVAYFLSRLSAATKRKEYQQAALAGGRYLLSIAKTDGQACLIFHNEPDGKDLYYLGWCHGPVGTANLFAELSRATGDEAWFEWVLKEAHGLMDSGIPEKETPGFWNNAGLCCGLAGVADFFRSLYLRTQNQHHLVFGRRVMKVLLDRATAEDGRTKWVQAEHRLRPELWVAQTGLMQGAAGIGLVLLRWDAFDNGRTPAIRLPDSAWTK
jgi:lantibiotic modifying enzyme